MINRGERVELFFNVKMKMPNVIFSEVHRVDNVCSRQDVSVANETVNQRALIVSARYPT